MKSLSSESRILYDLLMTESKEEYEQRFLDYKKDMLDSIKPFVADTTSQLRTMRTAVESIRSSMGVDLEDVKAYIGGEIDNMRESLGSEIAQLVAAVGRLSRLDPGARAAAPMATPTREQAGSSAGPEGHRCELQHRGQRVKARLLWSLFDGTNPKLWQRHCEEAFQRGHVDVVRWALLAADQFIGPAETWLESYLQQQPHPAWSEFVAIVLAHFSRNQHQVLSHQLIHIKQLTTVEDYVNRFSALLDQIGAYDSWPDLVHYITKFLDGLFPGV